MDNPIHPNSIHAMFQRKLADMQDSTSNEDAGSFAPHNPPTLTPAQAQQMSIDPSNTQGLSSYELSIVTGVNEQFARNQGPDFTTPQPVQPVMSDSEAARKKQLNKMVAQMRGEAVPEDRGDMLPSNGGKRREVGSTEADLHRAENQSSSQAFKDMHAQAQAGMEAMQKPTQWQKQQIANQAALAELVARSNSSTKQDH